jgi:hypothetical protein
MNDACAESDRLLPVGRTLFALRHVLRGSADAQLALQYLFFHADVNDPQVTPLLEQHGVTVGEAPALEDYICGRLRPWMRQIGVGETRASAWAESALRDLRTTVASSPETEAWALGVLVEELGKGGAGRNESWRIALAEGRPPGPEADRLIGAIGILQECCGVTISTAATTPWEIEKGAVR